MRIAIAFAVVIILAITRVDAAPNLNNSTQEPNVQAVQATANEIIPSIQEPSPQPQTEPIPEPQPTKPKVGCEQYIALIQQYDWNVSIATNVMRAESGCNPSAVGDNRVIGGLYAPSCGLFQIRTLKGRPSCEELKKPEVNIAYAYRLYLANKWSPWSVCRRVVRCH